MNKFNSALILCLSVTGLSIASGAAEAVVSRAGSQGPIGKTGPAGPAGPAGKMGPAGPQGLIGKTGPAGPIGPAGPQGLKGDTGATGAQGPIGLTGATGAAGTNGVDGAAGTNGVDGAVGPKGDTGLQGVKGDAGTNGIDGAAGPKGDTGLQGLIGLTGATGADSTVPGPTGPRGAPGNPTEGTNIGDMQYWDGTNWVMIPAPIFTENSPNIVTLHFCKNGAAPTWQDSCTVYHIGDTGPAGGIVFYVDASLKHGFEASTADQSAEFPIGQFWGCQGVLVGTQTGLGTGVTNTAAIIAAGCAGPGTAVDLAKSYQLNGYTDWFLPSKDELTLLYAQRAIVGGAGWNDHYYYSSSEYDADIAWVANGDYWGKVYGSPSGERVGVRAIRSF